MNDIKSSVSIFLCAVIIMGLCACGKAQPPSLINPNADASARAVYAYLQSISTQKTLSAQQESTWMGSVDYEMDYVHDASGRYPAMRGFDYMNDDFQGVNERAVEWWENGGLVTICWHTGKDFTGAWQEASDDVVEDWDKLLTEGTDEYNNMLAGMDKAAQALLELQDAGVTVLWRPFHEFDGGWFWWGKGTPENFIALWKIMYDRYTNYWHLNNLIWVLGFSHNGEKIKKWYPGDNYYDIIGADSYDKDTEQELLYKEIKKLAAKGKPMCFHECGENPSEADLSAMPWCYFMTWHSEFLTTPNSPEEISELYNSEAVITLDELDFRTVQQ